MGIKTDFSWVNAVDLATVAASSEASTLPAANLADARMGRVWRSLASTSFFTVTFATPTAIDILALAGTNLGATDTVRHRLYDGSGTLLFDSGDIPSGVLPGYNLHVCRLAAPLTDESGGWLVTEGGDVMVAEPLNVTSWRCDIVAPSRAAAGYFDVARAWAAPIWQPSIGISLPWDETWNDDADNTRSKLSGSIIVGDGPRYRTLNIGLKWMLDADRQQAKEMARVAGRSGQVLIVLNEAGDIPREAILGHIDKSQPITASVPTIPPRYGQSFTIIQDV